MKHLATTFRKTQHWDKAKVVGFLGELVSMRFDVNFPFYSFYGLQFDNKRNQQK